MKKSRAIITAALSAALMMPANFAGVKASAASVGNLSVYGGWNETIYAEWDEDDAENAEVSYKLSTDSSYTELSEDDKNLIRQEDEDTARVDIPGVEKGTYDLKITTSDGETLTASNVNVKENDRSGYAHYNYTRGVGAYNDDGTLKDNAIVLYVTDDNKDLVQVPGYEDYATGIGYILNGNMDLMSKIVADGHALDIRFLGKVTAPEGLTGYNSTLNGGTKGDNGEMAIIKMSKDVTLEGIGTDAGIDGWGFSFYVGQDYANRESYEVRNLTFKNYPEDALGFQGFMLDSHTLTTPIEHVWVHNNSFYPGYCAKPAESDKAEGDGSCDFKRGKNYTMDYNYYYGCHKTNLIGASDSNLQFNMTLHHNYYENCGSRSPLARQANIHIYNSYFKGNTAKTVDARANAYILSEANYYEDCHNPMLTKTGAVVKSFGDVVYNCYGSNTSKAVSSRDEKVSNNNTYSDFDTNSDIFYYNNQKKSSEVANLTSASQAKADCMAFSGVMKTSDKIVDKAESASVIKNKPVSAVSLPYSINFTDTSAADYAGTKMTNAGITGLSAGSLVTLDNVIYNVASKYNTKSTTFKLRSQGITFKVSKESVVTLSEPSGMGKYALVLYNENGDSLLTAEDGTAQVIVPAGTYMIQSSKADKDAYISKLELKAADGTEVKEPEKEKPSEENPSEDKEDKEDKKDDDVVIDTNNKVIKGVYNLNSSTITSKSAVYSNISVNCRSIGSTGVKLRSNNSIKFTVAKEYKLTIDASGKGIVLSTTDGEITYKGSTSKTVSVKEDGKIELILKEGTYVINGASNSGNTLISSITLAE